MKLKMALPHFVAIICLSLVAVCTARPFYPLPSKTSHPNKQPLQTSRPYNIAHRGSNGEIPEETTAAYMRAIEEGTDFIETDILSSRDGVLICFHDVILDYITDIVDHKEFADRKRTYEVQGHNMTGFFTGTDSTPLHLIDDHSELLTQLINFSAISYLLQSLLQACSYY
uniref:glycerophosphodiester phosphodiesterase n=1 Tax=Rhizophora mucronata TaxID=61149 RepID=A0A2P2KXQ6_RHIMU